MLSFIIERLAGKCMFGWFIVLCFPQITQPVLRYQMLELHQKIGELQISLDEQKQLFQLILPLVLHSSLRWINHTFVARWFRYTMIMREEKKINWGGKYKLGFERKGKKKQILKSFSLVSNWNFSTFLHTLQIIGYLPLNRLKLSTH